jgi:hypothetical protein
MVKLLSNLQRSFLLLCILCFQSQKASFSSSNETSVRVFHYISSNWASDRLVDGYQICHDVECYWVQSGSMNHLEVDFNKMTSTAGSSTSVITVALYNAHSLWNNHHTRFPLNCDWKTNFTMASSEESNIRYHHLFNNTFNNFDGYSTNHPGSTVQRIHRGAFLKTTDLKTNIYNHSSLVKAGSYIAKDCHKDDEANANRDGVVRLIREAGFRIEGLSKCMKTLNPEGIYLPKTPDTALNLLIKKDVIAKFMFNMAFENSIEDGYVTEKPFDALMAGTVPVYLGDATHLKALLPHPKAAIFVADYKGDYKALANYLNYLSNNESAYEEHRAW